VVTDQNLYLKVGKVKNTNCITDASGKAQHLAKANQSGAPKRRNEGGGGGIGKKRGQLHPNRVWGAARVETPIKKQKTKKGDKKKRNGEGTGCRGKSVLWVKKKQKGHEPERRRAVG